MATRKKSDEPVDVRAIVCRVVERVREVQACTIASCKVPKACKSDVLEQLLREGLEVTKTTVRRPLRDQLQDLIATGAFIPLTALRTHLKGATAAEAKKLALELVAAGDACLVLRGRKEWLVPASSPIVARDRLAPLIKGMDASLKLLRTTAKKRNTVLLREDLRSLVEPILAELATTVSKHPERAVDAARRLTDAAVGLAFVPAVVAALAEGSSRDAARDAILDAARAGEIELRPESGMGRLTDAERELCVAASDGTVLSWIRVCEAKS